MKNPTEGKRGRPKKPVREKLEANINFSCSQEMVDAVDEYTVKNGMSSRGHSARRLMQIALDSVKSVEK